MQGRRAAVFAVLLGVVGVVALAAPASANHRDDTLQVTIAINAAGNDRLSVTDDNFDTTSYASLASDVAMALDRGSGSFRSAEDYDGAHVLLYDKLARADGSGGLRYALDTGKLQLLAQKEGYDSVIVEVCTPRVRQVVDALVAPESSPGSSPGSRCRGWYQAVDEPPIRAVLQLAPDRHRYPWAVGRAVGTAAVAFGLLGIGATLLRRGPLRSRTWVSWILSVGAAVGVAPIGWGVATLILWLSGAANDAMLLGGGPVGEQVARTVLPGLVFVLPALLPAAVLLTVPRREKEPRPPPPPASPPVPAWWPTPWWSQWAAQGSPASTLPLPVPTAPPPPGTGWAQPGTHDG